jgi:hypothetical protein
MLELVVDTVREGMSRHGMALHEGDEWPSDEAYADAYVRAIEDASEELLGRTGEFMIPRRAQEAARRHIQAPTPVIESGPADPWGDQQSCFKSPCATGRGSNCRERR